MPDLASVVMQANLKKKKSTSFDSQREAPGKRTASGSTGSGVPSAQLSNGAAPAHLTPKPLVSEPDTISHEHRPARPRMKTQASFNWFDQSSQGLSSSLPRPPYTGAGIQEEDEDEDDEVSRGPGSPFKGAFTEADLSRGASNLSGGETQERGRKYKRPTARTARSMSVGAKGKGKQVEDGSTSERENGINGLDLARPAPTGPSGGDERFPSRRQSFWGRNKNYPASVHASGTSTPTGTGRPGSPTSPNAPRPKATRKGTAGWNAIRSRLKTGGLSEKKALNKTLGGHELITELSTGVLPLVLIKMGIMDRDEHNDHRIPILMNYLKLRITDSVYPFHDRHAVFRIELQYGDALVKWVIYRELKDFVNLHAHYRVANLRQGIDKFPPFPKTSLPYLNWLKSEGKGPVGKADAARLQREALEKYLLQLIRATMFGAGANRLCKFLEISALSVKLFNLGGEQGKQGYLRIMSSGASRRKEQGFHPFSLKNRHDPKWFIVRDSYIVAVDEPASLKVYDVFMIDSTFELIRPKRIYRKGLHFLKQRTGNSSSDDEANPDAPHPEIDDLHTDKSERHNGVGAIDDPSTTNADPNHLKDTSNHTFYLKCSERRMRLVAKTERQQDQFIASIEKMIAKSIWAGKNRFDSFAPIRLNVAAQWLIDGRDYFWSLSRAIMLAKEKIYIHDWWLSPELYLRRSPADNYKWRLDRLLQRKAKEGVQIFVIVYKEVSNDFTPVDSNWTKTQLRKLHPNIHVQRSPSHTSTGTLLWSHHEKMCVIDETIGFMGGFDLCFGRWDTPQHELIDDGLEEDEPVQNAQSQNGHNRDHSPNQIWPGKDYSNQRVLDFHTLNKPDEDMYDRTKVPRQPWHDIGLQIIGQPARDLCRHFVQRWNYLLRTKNHTIEMPFLLPPAEFTPKQLHQQRITGTCEAQICRSVGPWSMGINHVEHSIQNAYIKAIQLSDHFVYIENQFFITSTEVEGVVIENKIGDALVSRIIRAHSEGTAWRAIIVIPLVPGYPYPIDHSDAGSVRLIMECQNRTISRGPHSIFARLRREGIDPDEHITFFGLRGWGKLATGALTTEAVYIHAKAMIVDDRTVIIGSANINERSQRGDRDSELACIIRDTDMLDSTMAGKPYQVGRFAHTMRIRLMREHLGVDVDAVHEEDGVDEDLMAREPTKMQEPEDAWDPDNDQKQGSTGVSDERTHPFKDKAKAQKSSGGKKLGAFAEAAGLAGQKGLGVGPGGNRQPESGDGTVNDQTDSTDVPTLEEKVMAEGRLGSEGAEKTGGAPQANGNQGVTEGDDPKQNDYSPGEVNETTKKSPWGDLSEKSPTANGEGNSTARLGADARSLSPVRGGREPTSPNGSSTLLSTNGSSIRGKSRVRPNAYNLPPSPEIDPNGFTDPVDGAFYKNVWMATAVRNTQAFRKVFRCVPDDLVQTWKQYREFQAWAERHNKPPKDVVPAGDEAPHDPEHRHGAGGGGTGGGAMGEGEKDGSEAPSEGVARTTTQSSARASRTRASSILSRGGDPKQPSTTGGPAEGHDHDEMFPAWEREQMEALLNDMHGTLVLYPTKFLEAESNGGNFLFSKDRLPPLSIYD